MKMDDESYVEDTTVEDILALLEPVGGWLSAPPSPPPPEPPVGWDFTAGQPLR